MERMFARRGVSPEAVDVQPSVAVVAVGDPASQATWSGVTAGIVAGLRGLGVRVRPVDLSLPVGLEQALQLAGAARTRNRYDAEGAALTRRARGALARRRLRAPRLDGVIQIGTTFRLATGAPYATLEDMTLRQAAASHPVFSRMSAAAIARWERERGQIYARAAACTAASRWTADSLRDDYSIARARVAVVGFGANHVAEVPQRDWSVPRFLFIGIDWARKGGPRVLEAFARVREAHPQATLDVVGDHPRLQQLGVTGHGVLSRESERDRVIVAELFGRATCLVMPSRIEPFGIVHVEAASAGVPSITGSVGGARDVIGESGGVAVAPGDDRALLEAMLRLSDPDTARSMGTAARERSQLYTWPKVAERLLRALGLPAPDGRGLAQFL